MQSFFTPRLFVLSVLSLSLCCVEGLFADDPEPPVPSWIWAAGGETVEEAFLRKQWTQGKPVKAAHIRVSADDSYELYLNGQEIAAGKNWRKAPTVDVKKYIGQGDNVVAIRAVNKAEKGGAVLVMKLVHEDGSIRYLATDDTWQVSTKEVSGWKTPSVDQTNFQKASVIASYGAKPWGEVFAAARSKQAGQSKSKKGADVIEPAKVLPAGFTLEKLYDVPLDDFGSWVSMATDDQGRLYCSDQGEKGIYRITFSSDKAPVVEKLPIELSSAQGLYWREGVLFAVVHNKKDATKGGFFRIEDTDGDSLPDRTKRLSILSGKGEHGPHAIVPAPDGESLFLVAGNFAETPDPDQFRVHPNYQEDQLLPSMPDARGHAKDTKAPGGWVVRTDGEGSFFELYAAGLRNSYDMAANAHGEFFIYDADMEWDLGSPWYRPTRIYHVTSGAEYGWRTGSGKWPAHYPDVLPPALEVGPGSPTGVVSGLGAKFPAKYQNAVYAFDWTYGTIYALHQKPVGSSYTLEKEEFVTGVPLYLTDGVIAPDGSLYFAVGGRNTASAIYRVSYTGEESTAPAPAAPGPEQKLRDLRREMEALQSEQSGAIEKLWPQLGHEDRFIRYAARVALEHQPAAEWAEKALAETDIETSLSALLALSRQGDEPHRAPIIGNLEKLFQRDLDEVQHLAAQRVLHLALVRLGGVKENEIAGIRSKLETQFPAASETMNRELVYTLTALQSDQIVAAAMPMLRSADAETTEVNEELISRSGRYGKVFAEMQTASPPKMQVWVAYVLRNAKRGWTPELQAEYFSWFATARDYKGGLSFQGFIDEIRKQALTNVASQADRPQLEALSQKTTDGIAAGFAEARKLQVGVLPGLKFDTDLIEAKAGEKIALHFKNSDPTGIQHNLVISSKGSAETVVAASMQIGPDSVKNDFVPQIPEVLAATPQIGPGQTHVLYYEVPKEKGDYHFICTYPGHSQVMQGIFRVK